MAHSTTMNVTLYCHRLSDGLDINGRCGPRCECDHRLTDEEVTMAHIPKTFQQIDRDASRCGYGDCTQLATHWVREYQPNNNPYPPAPWDKPYGELLEARMMCDKHYMLHHNGDGQLTTDGTLIKITPIK